MFVYTVCIYIYIYTYNIHMSGLPLRSVEIVRVFEGLCSLESDHFELERLVGFGGFKN